MQAITGKQDKQGGQYRRLKLGIWRKDQILVKKREDKIEHFSL